LISLDHLASDVGLLRLDHDHVPDHIGPSAHSSFLFIERRLVGFVSELGRGFGYLGAQLMQNGFRSPSQPKVSTGDARRPAAKLRQHKASHLVDHGFVRVTPHQFAPLLHQAHLQHLGLDLDVISVRLRARRVAMLAPQVSQVGNAALVEREAVTLPLDHAFGFELPNVGPAAIKVLR
jgi:hypothetical protein